MTVVTFRLFKQRNNNQEINSSDLDIIFSKEWDLVGVKVDKLIPKEIKNIKNKYKLDNFYSTQAKIKCLIKNAKKLDITFIDIKFSAELNNDDHDMLRTLLQNKNMEKLLEFIEMVTEYEEIDISEINFVLGEKYKDFKGTNISVTTNGKFVTKSKIEIEFKNLFSSEIFGVLVGKYQIC